MTSFVALLLFAATLFVFEYLEVEYFKQGHEDQESFFAKIQDKFVQRHDSSADIFLVKLQEAGNANLARLFSNTLWDHDFAPFVARTQRFNVEQCRAIADTRDDSGKGTPTHEKLDCYARIRQAIMALPEYRLLDAKLFDTMKKTSVFKIKVFDRRGITVYSSENSQVGEDRRGTEAWETAMAGKTVSQLSFRDRFTAFEGVVTSRDLVSSYMPVHDPRTGNVAGVLEVYSDVTQYLAQIRGTSVEIRTVVAANQAEFEQAAAVARASIATKSKLLFAATLAALALLYVVLRQIVSKGQRIIEKQDAERARVEEELQQYVAQLKSAFMSTVEVATTISEMRDPYTAGHERRVAEVAAAIGAELGFDDRRLEGLRVGGYLHDLGKITIPAEILSKPGKLKPIELDLIRGHPEAGYEALKNVNFPWPIADMARQHHERVDGSGYPQGLKGEAILLEARILGVADTVEAMSSHRPYRAALGIDVALAEIERGRGSLYDPPVVDACLRLFRVKGYEIPA